MLTLYKKRLFKKILILISIIITFNNFYILKNTIKVLKMLTSLPLFCLKAFFKKYIYK